MTDIEKLSFFEQTKGKKIKWYGWSRKDHYFIPERQSGVSRERVIGRNANGRMVSWNIESGLHSKGWMFFDGTPSQQEVDTKVFVKKHNCSCPLLTMMQQGCSCGGV